MPRKITRRPRKRGYRYKRAAGPKRRAVKSHASQIQCANYLPKNRLIKFQDFRSFVVTDNATPDIGGGTHVAHVPNLQISANDPGNAFILGADSKVGSTGQWYSQSADPTTGNPSKGTAVPNLAQWICNADGSGTGHYRTAQCLSAKLTINAVPLSTSVHDGTSKQDVSKLMVQLSTQADHYKAKRINEDFNSEKLSQLPLTSTANIYSNFNGTPRGGTITRTYSFKKMNATIGRSSMNVFALDNSPPERDFFQIAFLPCDNEDYGTGASDTSTGTDRIPNMRVSVKIEYICLLSEPNVETIGGNDNTGVALPEMPMREVTDM